MMRKLVFSMMMVVVGLSSAPAADIFNNILAQQDYLVPMNSNGAGVWQYNAEAFTTPVSTYPLMSTTLVLAASSVGSSTGSFTIELWSDSASAPGSKLADISTGNTISGLGLTPTPTNIKFDMASPYALASSTSYWIVVNTSALSGGKQLQVVGTNSANGVGVTANNNMQQGGSPPFTTTFGNPSHMLMVVVPEPSTYALGFTAMSVMALVARRRKTAA